MGKLSDFTPGCHKGYSCASFDMGLSFQSGVLMGSPVIKFEVPMSKRGPSEHLGESRPSLIDGEGLVSLGLPRGLFPENLIVWREFEF